MPSLTRSPSLAALRRGLSVSWLTVVLIAAINTGIAGLLWIDDPRPFWHPFITAQCMGFSIAYCVNVASPWEKRRPVARLVLAVLVGAVAGMLLTSLLKGYTLADVRERSGTFALTVMTGFTTGLFVSLFFLLKFRESRAESALLKAEAERHLLSKQAIESELKLMQAQVEPHFLFNTLASVQYLTETNPPEASRLLGHLLHYLRAAVPQLRSSATTLGKEVDLAGAYLNVLKMRMGARLAFEIDVPPALANVPFPPVLLISLVENAIEHGLDARAEGGTVRIHAERNNGSVAVSVTDTGSGLAHGHSSAGNGRGLGLANVRERLAALYGTRARFTLEDVAPHGARATIEIPVEPA